MITQHQATKVCCQPYYGGERDTKSASAWAITWTQTFALTADTDSEGLDDIRPLLELLTKYDLAPAPDGVFEATDVTTLTPGG